MKHERSSTLKVYFCTEKKQHDLVLRETSRKHFILTKMIVTYLQILNVLKIQNDLMKNEITFIK